jgi:hypothetical protein
MGNKTKKTNDERHYLIDRNIMRLYSKMVFLAEYFESVCRQGGTTLSPDAASGLSCIAGDVVLGLIQLREWNFETAKKNFTDITITSNLDISLKED